MNISIGREYRISNKELRITKCRRIARELVCGAHSTGGMIPDQIITAKEMRGTGGRSLSFDYTQDRFCAGQAYEDCAALPATAKRTKRET